MKLYDLELSLFFLIFVSSLKGVFEVSKFMKLHVVGSLTGDPTLSGPQVVTQPFLDVFFLLYFFPFCLSFNSIRTACQITFRSDIIEIKFRTSQVEPVGAGFSFLCPIIPYRSGFAGCSAS